MKYQKAILLILSDFHKYQNITLDLFRICDKIVMLKFNRNGVILCQEYAVSLAKKLCQVIIVRIHYKQPKENGKRIFKKLKLLMKMVK